MNGRMVYDQQTLCFLKQKRWVLTWYAADGFVFLFSQKLVVGSTSLSGATTLATQLTSFILLLRVITLVNSKLYIYNDNIYNIIYIYIYDNICIKVCVFTHISSLKKHKKKKVKRRLSTLSQCVSYQTVPLLYAKDWPQTKLAKWPKTRMIWLGFAPC